jgi:4-azaleucine resistance transporter AzlC
MAVISRSTELWSGVRDEAPILLGVAPFGLVFGALALNSGMTVAAAQAMSSIVFAGSAQFISAQLIGAGASGLVIVMVVAVVNLRHALYSASIAPYVSALRPAWKLLLSYLLTDEAYAVAITGYRKRGSDGTRHWYFFGAGIALWTCWQMSTAVGIFLGALIPQDWPLAFMLPLTFVALVVPALEDRSTTIAAAVAAAVGLVAAGLPLKTGLLIAASAGIAAGMLSERKGP